MGGKLFTLYLVPTYLPIINSINEGSKSQNLMLFIREYAISGVPSIRGTKKFPNPPIIKGITVKSYKCMSNN